MIQEGIKPNLDTFTHLLDAFRVNNTVREILHKEILASGLNETRLLNHDLRNQIIVGNSTSIYNVIKLIKYPDVNTRYLKIKFHKINGNIKQCWIDYKRALSSIPGIGFFNQMLKIVCKFKDRKSLNSDKRSVELIMNDMKRLGVEPNERTHSIIDPFNKRNQQEKIAIEEMRMRLKQRELDTFLYSQPSVKIAPEVLLELLQHLEIKC